jgi:hypothetical protein
MRAAPTSCMPASVRSAPRSRSRPRSAPRLRPRSLRAVFGIALLTGATSGCRPRCPSAELAPIPTDGRPRFAVLSIDPLLPRLEIHLLDAPSTSAPERAWITWSVAGVDTDVWLDELTRWNGMRIPHPLDLTAHLPPRGVPSLRPADPAIPAIPAVTAWLEDRAQWIVRFPLRAAAPGGDGEDALDVASAPRETRTELVDRPSVPDAFDAPIREILHAAEHDEDPEHYLLAMRGPASTDDRGDDVVLIQFSREPERADDLPIARIPLRSATDSAPADPRRAVWIDRIERLFVGLDRGTSAAALAPGPGAIAIVDPFGRRVSRILEIPGMTGCGEIAAGEAATEEDGTGHTQQLLVACSGSGQSAAERRATSGFALIESTTDLDPDAPAGTPIADPTVWVSLVWPASIVAPLLPSRGLSALPGNVAVIVSDALETDDPEDVLFAFDVDDGRLVAPRIVSGVHGPTSVELRLGAPVYDPASGFLIIPSGRPGVTRRRVVLDGASGSAVAFCPGDGTDCTAADEPFRVAVPTCNRLLAWEAQWLGAPELPSSAASRHD